MDQSCCVSVFFISKQCFKVQQNKKMSGSECCTNPPTLNPTRGGGHVEKLGGLNTYVTGSLHSKLAVLLVSDILLSWPHPAGYDAPNLRKPTDKIAAAGFYVAVLDLLHGDPYVPSAGRTVQDWLKDHGMDKAFEEVKPVIQPLKGKGITAIGAAGFCCGGKIKVWPYSPIAFYGFTVEVPIAVLGAEIDQISPPALVKHFEEVLTAKTEVDGFVKIFPEVAHGWTVRYNVKDESAVKCAEEARQNMLEWFARYVK